MLTDMTASKDRQTPTESRSTRRTGISAVEGELGGMLFRPPCALQRWSCGPRMLLKMNPHVHRHEGSLGWNIYIRVAYSGSAVAAAAKATCRRTHEEAPS